MYIYLFSMILSHSSYKNYFENFPKSKIPILYTVSGLAVDWAGQPDLFQARTVDRPVDHVLCPGRARLCTSVGRPTGRPTENRLLSVFCRSADRSTDS